MKVNTKIIKALYPCRDRFDNWLKHYKNFDGDILDFLSLNKITASDKIWVTLRLLLNDGDSFTVRTFAIDCALAAVASDYAAEVAAAYAGYAIDAELAADTATAYAAYVAVYSDEPYIEKERQVDSLIYLITNRSK